MKKGDTANYYGLCANAMYIHIPPKKAEQFGWTIHSENLGHAFLELRFSV